MKKWEYCSVGPIEKNGFAITSGLFTQITFFTEEGAVINPFWDKGNKKISLPEAFSMLGSDGWEMTGCGPVGDGEEIVHVLYFKRSLE